MVVQNSSMSYLQDLGTAYVPNLFCSQVYVGISAIFGPNSTFLQVRYYMVAKKSLDPIPKHNHKTHTQLKCANRHPTLHWLCPISIHGNTCHGPRFWSSRFLLVKGRRMASGLLSPPLVPLFWAPKSDP